MVANKPQPLRLAARALWQFTYDCEIPTCLWQLRRQRPVNGRKRAILKLRNCTQGRYALWVDIILILPICSARSFGWLNPSGKCLPATAPSLILTQRFGKKALICWVFMTTALPKSSAPADRRHTPRCFILPYRRKVIPARIFFQIRITPLLKSNLWQHVLPNKDASYRNKTSKDTSFPSGSQFPTALVRSKFPIYIHSGEPQ